MGDFFISSTKPGFLQMQIQKKIKNGFQCTGIHPFNQGAIPSEAFLPSTIYTAEVKDQETMETEGIGIEIGTTLHSSFDHSLLNSNKIIKF